MIQFQTKNSKTIDLNISYDNNIIEQVNNHKFLGISLDKDLNWKTHIEIICDRINRCVYILKRLRNTVSTKAAITAYHVYVSSVLSYGLILWGESTDHKKAFIAQKKCIRALYGLGQRDSCRDIFSKLRILTLTCMYIREVCLLAKNHPEYFKRKGDVNTYITTRHKNKLYFPTCRINMAKNSVIFRTIAIYNKIPDNFKSLPINLFKNRLTNWLMRKQFYNIDEFMNDV